MRRVRSRAFSLAEALVGLAIIGVLSTMVAQLFQVGALLGTQGQRGARAEEALALGLHSIVRELPEASPIYTLNGAIFRTSGGMLCEAVTVPELGETSGFLEFLELDPAQVGPLQLDQFVATDPSFYRLVSWVAVGDSLMREVRPYNAVRGDFVAAAAARATTRLPGFFIVLYTRSLGSSEYRITLQARSDDPHEPTREVVAHVHLRPR